MTESLDRLTGCMLPSGDYYILLSYYRYCYILVYYTTHYSTFRQVQWMSGSLASTPLTVDGPKWHW